MLIRCTAPPLTSAAVSAADSLKVSPSSSLTFTPLVVSFPLHNAQNRVMIEYVMLAGVNDSQENAHELGRLLKGRDLVINAAYSSDFAVAFLPGFSRLNSPSLHLAISALQIALPPLFDDLVHACLLPPLQLSCLIHALGASSQLINLIPYNPTDVGMGYKAPAGQTQFGVSAAVAVVACQSCSPVRVLGRLPFACPLADHFCCCACVVACCCRRRHAGVLADSAPGVRPLYHGTSFVLNVEPHS